MKKPNQLHQVTRAVANSMLAYKYLLGFFALTVILSAATGDATVFAGDTGGNFGQFNAYVCRLRLLIGTLIGAIAVVMIVMAGIIYATSGLSGKGAASISTAKTMITSAITGVVFYMLSNVLLGNCASGVSGGLFGEIFKNGGGGTITKEEGGGFGGEGDGGGGTGW